MLSESTQVGMSGGAALARRALYSRGREARLWGIAAGSVVLALVSALMILAPSGMAVGILLVVPVALLSWFGSAWTGRVGAAMGASAHILTDLTVGRPLDAVAVTNAVVVLAVLMLVAELLPGLRFASQAYRDHAQTDPLTNLGNRRFFREVALVELNRSKRYDRPVSLLYLDADNFGRIRNVAGHAESDMLLVQMASVMTGSLRTSDVVARISGAEFAILLPETDGDGARVVAEKIRQKLVAATMAAGHEIRFRVAVVGTPQGPVSLDAILRQADEAMLEARRSDTDTLSYRDYVHPPMQLV